jgi:hypothetical protein
MAGVSDHHVDRKKLMAALPKDLRRIVKALPDCPCCGDVNVDQTANWLLDIVCTTIKTQDPRWAANALESCKRFIDHHATNVSQTPPLPQ